MRDLELIVVNRSYVPNNFGLINKRELHTYVDASESAIGCVIYLKLTDHTDRSSVNFVISASRVNPKSCTSMPRSELCAALLGVKLYSEVLRELKFDIDGSYFYSDSKVVLSYISNTTKRFTKYVSNRILSILKVTFPEQWLYINSAYNPADLASRPQTVEALRASNWLTGPDDLWQTTSPSERPEATPNLVDELPETLELKATVKVCKKRL